MSIRDDFVKFIQQGNLVQLAIAFVIGAAFAAVVAALVADLITPLIGAIFHVNFAALTYTLNGSVFYPGLFLNAILTFVIVALVVFFVIALPYQRHMDAVAKRKGAAPPTTRACPQCLTQIPLAATRCSACTQAVPPVPPTPPAAPPASS